MPKCKKCNKEITKGDLCERCKTIKFGKLKKAMGTGGGTILFLSVLVLTKGKIKLPLK